MKSKTGLLSLTIIGILVEVGAILFQSQRVFAERASLKTVLGLDNVPSKENSDDYQSVPTNEPFAAKRIDERTTPEPVVSTDTQAYQQAIDTLVRLVDELDKYYAEGCYILLCEPRLLSLCLISYRMGTQCQLNGSITCGY